VTLDTLNGLGADSLVDVLTDTLTVLGLSSLVDTVLDEVAQALVTNTLTLLQSTEVTAALTEYAFDGDLALAGNVVTGGAVGDVADGIAEGGVVTQVMNSEGGVVAVLGNGTETVTIDGLYGQLTISKDGSYTYDAQGARAALGQDEVFTYTVTNGAFNPDGSRVTQDATLTITIDGQGTAGDIAFAQVEYDYATAPGVDLENDIGFSWLLGALGATVWTRQDGTSEQISVAENTTQDLTITLNGGDLLSVGGDTLINLEKLVDGSWEIERSFDNDQLVGLLGLGSDSEIVIPGLTAGEYRITMDVGSGLLSLAGSIGADIQSVVTELDNFTIAADGVTAATGNLLNNDVVRSDELGNPLDFTLSVSLDGTAYQSTEGAPVTLVGTYGSLEVQANGDYTYTPRGDLENFVDPLSDTFSYQITYEGGLVEEAELTVFVESSNPANEVFVVDNAAFDSIDGGGGFDILLLDSGIDLDFTNAATPSVENIERVDLGDENGANALTLSEQAVMDLTDADNRLQIHGDAEDTVSALGATSMGITDIGGVSYNQYTLGSTTLLIDDDITVTI